VAADTFGGPTRLKARLLLNDSVVLAKSNEYTTTKTYSSEDTDTIDAERAISRQDTLST
jgi:hypothetical protein